MKKKKILGQFGNTKGQAITEFALTFPIFFILLLFSMQFGSAIYQAHALYKAADRGARAAVTSPGDKPTRIRAAEIAVTAALKAGFYKFQDIDTQVTIPTDGTPITVTVQAKPKMVFIKGFRQDPLDATAPLLKYKSTASAFPNYRGRPTNVAPKP